MKVALAVCLSLLACGKKTESTSSSGSGSTTAKPAGDRFAKVKQPKVSPICEKARSYFGYGAECIETELPDLASAAGTITRVMKKGDPTRDWIYVLARPDGSMYAGSGGGNSRVFDEVLKGLDTKATPPDILAKLEAVLDRDMAIVRCLPGSNDKLPDKDGKPVECRPPAISKQGDKTVLSYTIEIFPHSRLTTREDHYVSFYKSEVKDHEISFVEGDFLLDLPLDAPMPANAPPPPTMTTPPDWVAKPVAAPDDVSKALCAFAVENVAEMMRKGRQCKAFAYPSLDTPAGSLFYLATDSGRHHLLAWKKPDGTLAVDFDVDGTQAMLDVVKNYDPKTMPADKIVALYLFLAGEAAHILCLPGSNDVIPDNTCDPPKVERKGDGLVLTYIVQEFSFPDMHGNVSYPSVLSYSTKLSSSGGSLGGGFRLVDMRE